MKKLLIIAMMFALAVVLLQGCSKDVLSTARFGGPCSVTLVILNSDSSAGTKSTVDETDLVHSIRIYAFKHAPGEAANDTLVGYGLYTGLTGEGPYYCTLALSASGDIDFYVLANDEFATVASVGTTAAGDDDTSTTELTESTTRDQLEAVRISGMTGTTSDGDTGTIAVPMSNFMDGELSAIDANNFSYNIPDDPDNTTVVSVDVKRAMARLSLYFAKTSATGTVKVTSATLREATPASSVLLFPPGTSVVFNTAAAAHEDNFFESTDGVSITKTMELSNLSSAESSDFQQLAYDGTMTGTTAGDAAETYMLPSPYGSSTTLTYTLEASADVEQDSLTDAEAENRSYALDIGYTVDDVAYSGTVYLPYVDPNDHIKVRVLFDYEEETQTATINVVVVSWTTYTISDITFS